MINLNHVEIVYSSDISRNTNRESIAADYYKFDIDSKCFLFYRGNEEDYECTPNDNLILIVPRANVLSIRPFFKIDL